MNMNNRVKKPVEFCAEHFDALNALKYAQKSQLFTSISLELLATACCLITKTAYLKELLTCLDPQQSKFVLVAIGKKQKLKPNPLFIARVQKMIISLHTMFSEVICDINEFTLLPNTAIENQDFDFEFSEFLPIIDRDITSNDISSYSIKNKAIFCEKTFKEKIKQVGNKDEGKHQAVLQAGALKNLYYPTPSSLTNLDILAKNYPNFNYVINLIKNSIQIHLLGGADFSFPIINLQGKPGCGKTCFVKALANTLQLEFFLLNIASMNARFELIGGNKQYGDANIGAIGQIMCLEAKTYQPLILIDELCMAKDNSNDSVIQPLYGFFDREQRKCFKEHYLNIELNLSGVLIITTTNNFENLKPALQSRLVNIEIKPPTKKQMFLIISTIFNESLENMALAPYFEQELPQTILSLLAKKSPRIVKEDIRQAIGQACLRVIKGIKVTLNIKDFNAAKTEQIKISSLKFKKLDKLH